MSGRLVVAVVLGLSVAIAGGAGIFVATRGHPAGKVPLEPIDYNALRRDVRALAGVDPGPLLALVLADSSVKEFATRAAGKADGAAAQAAAVVRAIQARKAAGAFVEWPRVDPRDGAPLTASGTLAALQRDGARRELYPLELSALAVSSLRSLGVDAMLAEIYAFPNDESVADPSAKLGYYGAFVPAQAGGAAAVYDAYGGRQQPPAPDDYVVLNDAQAVGAALALRALGHLGYPHDPEQAQADADAALKLSPQSPTVRMVRSSVLLTREKGDVEGTKELEEAARLRPDDARTMALAFRSLARGDATDALAKIKPVLEHAPKYAQAHLVLATTYLVLGRQDEARVQLELVDKLEPSLPQLPQIWSQFYSAKGDKQSAVRFAEEGVKRSPKDPQPLLILARAERAAGLLDAAREHAKQVMQLVPAEDQERRKRQLRGLLGEAVVAD